MVIVLLKNAIAAQMALWKHREAVAGMLRAQANCMDYQIAAGRLVFDSRTDNRFHPVAYDNLVRSLGPSFGRSSLNFDIGGGFLLMHELTYAPGRPVLMIINLHGPRYDNGPFMLRCYQVEPGDVTHPAQINQISCPLEIHVPLLATVLAGAGSVSSSDPARFTVPLWLNGQAVTVVGTLQADRSVAFTASAGLMIPSDDPKEGAALFFQCLPSTDDVVHTRYMPFSVIKHRAAH